MDNEKIHDMMDIKRSRQIKWAEQFKNIHPNKTSKKPVMDNEITINGEVYVRKIKDLCDCKPMLCTHIESLGYKDPIFKKRWPQERDEYWFVDEEGQICCDTYHYPDDYRSNLMKERGNLFQTEEEAKMYSLRIESLSKGFIPQEWDGEIFFYWDFDDNGPHEDFRVWIALLYPKFPTKEECQEWYEEFGASWEYLLTNKK